MTGANEDCSLGRTDFTDKSDDRVGHLNTILARGGGNLNNQIFKSSNVRGLPGEGGGGELISALLPEKLGGDVELAYCNR